MFCNHCGQQLPDGSRFCANCGQEVKPLQGGQDPAEPQQTSLWRDEEELTGRLPVGQASLGGRQYQDSLAGQQSSFGGRQYQDSLAGQQAPHSGQQYQDSLAGQQAPHGGRQYQDSLAGQQAPHGGRQYQDSLAGQGRQSTGGRQAWDAENDAFARQEHAYGSRTQESVSGWQPGPGVSPAVETAAPSGQKRGNKTALILAIVSSVLALAAVVALVLVLLPKLQGGNQTTEAQPALADSGPSAPAAQPGGAASAQTDAQTDTQSTEQPTEPETEAPTDYRSVFQRIDAQGRDFTLRLVTMDVSDYPTVRLYYRTEDAAGGSVLLTSPTAGIVERINGGEEIERTVRSVEQLEDNEGLGIDILIDKSGSMSHDFPEVQSTLRRFILSLDYGAGDHAELISFDSFVMYMCSYTNDSDRLLNGIDNMEPDGQTALYDALYAGVNNASARPGANCVIAFTDGEDNASTHSYAEVVRLAQTRNVPIYLIGTSGADQNVLRNLAAETGGSYWNINSIGDMGEILNEIYGTQKDMYCVEYESDPNADPYASRSVSCVLWGDTLGSYEEHAEFTPVETIEVQQHSSRYEIISADLSWTEANDACLARGGHLATITSQAEMDQIVALAESAGLKYLWIGGYTSVRNGTAFGHWITGEPFDYTAWSPNEPSRNDLDGTPECYLMLWKLNDEWSWNDQRNDVVSALSYFRGRIGYVCEYEENN